MNDKRQEMLLEIIEEQRAELKVLREQNYSLESTNKRIINRLRELEEENYLLKEEVAITKQQAGVPVEPAGKVGE